MTLNGNPLIDEDKFNEICHNPNVIKKDNNSQKIVKYFQIEILQIMIH